MRVLNNKPYVVSLDKIDVLQTACVTRNKLSDGSAQIIIYNKPCSNVELKVYKLNALRNDRFELETIITERKPVLIINIKRANAHRYLLCIVNSNGTTFKEVKTYEELNGVLRPFINEFINARGNTLV